jgi:hypothetical protein
VRWLRLVWLVHNITIYSASNEAQSVTGRLC